MTQPTDAPDGIAGVAVDLMDALGGPGAAVVVGMDNLFPPIPSELVLPLAGFSASQGSMSLAAALTWTTIGSVAGALIVYLLGALLGRDRTRRLIARIPLLRAEDFDRTERWFARHGTKAVFFGRMVPIFRSLVSLPAGIERMRMWTFLALTTAGSLIWNTGLVLAGYTLGENWHLAERYVGILQKLVIGLVVLAVALIVIIRLGSGERRRRGSAGSPPDRDSRGRYGTRPTRR